METTTGLTANVHILYRTQDPTCKQHNEECKQRMTAHMATSGKCIAIEINTGSDIGGFDRHLGMKEEDQSCKSRYKARQTDQTWTGLDHQDCLFSLFRSPIW